jgi:probable F420-dependent oxidoreductase
MRFGIGLPQYGPATPEGLMTAARQAEDLGFDDVWAADHIAVPSGVRYPPPFLLESLSTLSFVAAVTSRARLGTSVLVLALRRPLVAAKQLATLDRLSGGRLIVGVGAGWLQGEFDAVGVPFHQRGALTDEALGALRAAWSSSPASFSGPTTDFHDVKVTPLPARPIPVWIGGTSQRALQRAVERGDGWQGNFLTPDEAAPMLAWLRKQRPEESFTLSLRVDVDGLNGDLDRLRRDLDAYAAAGIQHLLTAPVQRDLDAWLRSVERLWSVFEGWAG